MLPFEQGGLDSLCGIYSIVNAERIINNTVSQDSQDLFNKIVQYLESQRSLATILTKGMLLKHITTVLDDVVGDRVAYKKRHFAGVETPDLNTFWTEVASFLNKNNGANRAVLLGISGFYDHWTVVKKISESSIDLLDSDGLRRFNRINCTTSDAKGKRRHVLCPAQTYFLGNHND
ncbi:hypothetical protein [Nitrosomonas sp. Nm34]|uniref:hypothetical protein n=1 Tax=Nitrosomonas sp. Nm34 TaxID=1881055 RepID=UPI0008F436DF|nr:hypothetical protein [Nitrosomonas sp. Nm34]SFJ09140.1 hypothetical protein SAMN05428978_11023 [Nitrosomonas sp. Nm34]